MRTSRAPITGSGDGDRGTISSDCSASYVQCKLSFVIGKEIFKPLERYLKIKTPIGFSLSSIRTRLVAGFDGCACRTSDPNLDV